MRVGAGGCGWVEVYLWWVGINELFYGWMGVGGSMFLDIFYRSIGVGEGE